LFAFALASCGGSPEKTYSKHGVTFTKPAGWKVTDEEYLPEANTVFVEKEGFTSSGLVLVQWYPEPVDPEMMVQVYVESLSAADETTNFERAEIESIEINGEKGASIRFSFRASGMPCSGKCYCYPCGSSTMLVSVQGADEDKEANDTGFKTVEKSIECEGKVMSMK
jgi:hypothetical protein